MIVFRRLGIVQTASLAGSAAVATICGLLERSWTWGFTSAVVAYATFRVGATVLTNIKFRSFRTWLKIDTDWSEDSNTPDRRSIS